MPDACASGISSFWMVFTRWRGGLYARENRRRTRKTPREPSSLNLNAASRGLLQDCGAEAVEFGFGDAGPE